MALTKATQDVIETSICTTDTTQTITGSKNFSNLSGNVSSATALATGSTTARTLANRFGDIFNVKDFGAVGNGIVNDKNAIQLAIDTATAAGGGTVYFPKGTYLTKSTILAKSNVTLQGDGFESEIKADPNFQIWTSPLGPGPYEHIGDGYFLFLIVDNRTNITFRNLKINSSLLNPPNTIPPLTGNSWFSAKDIFSYQASNIIVDNCEFLCAGSATAMTDVSNYVITNNKITQSALDNKYHADAQIDQWRDINNAHIENNSIDGNSLVGILVTANTGYSPSNIKNVKVLGNYVNNAGVGIHIMGRDGILDGVCVANNIIENSVEVSPGLGTALAITDSKNVVCSNNVINKSYKSGILIGREGVEFEGIGSISGNILTITSVTYGTIHPGTINNRVSGSGVAFQQTYVLSQLSGTTGGVGTYQINLSQTVPSTNLYIGGWFAPLYGFENIVCSNNVIANAGYLNSGSSTSQVKSAIQVTQGNPNKCALIANNTVHGSTHSYCAYLDIQGVQHIGGTYQVGQAFTYTNIGSMIRFGTEGNQGIKWVSFSENDKRTEIYSTVNANSAYQELQFNNGYTRFNQVSGSGLNTALEITRVNGSQTGIMIFPESNTTTGPIIIATSTAANSDLYLFPKANGHVKYGTYVNTPSVITGYIEIKDSGNNIRKLAVIA